MAKKQIQKTKIKTRLLALAIFGFVLLLSLLAEFFITPHANFGVEDKMFFHAWYGFISCAAMVIISKLLGFFLKRNENYYREMRGEE